MAPIATDGPIIAAALVDHPTVEVYVLGGLFRALRSHGGAAAAEAAHTVQADMFLLGITGVHHSAGLTTGDADEAAMKRSLARRVAGTYVLASAKKIGTASPFTVLPLADVSGSLPMLPPTSRPGTSATRRLHHHQRRLTLRTQPPPRPAR